MENLKLIPQRPSQNLRKAQLKVNEFARVSAVCFALAAFTGLFVAWIALSERSIDFPEWINQEGASCVRVQRERGAAIALIPLGTPPRILRAVVRLDRVVDPNDNSLTLFADELLRSDTLRCDQSRTCTDAALITTNSTSGQTAAVLRFNYGTFFDEAYAVARSLGAEGELSLTRHSRAFLGKTHFCSSQNFSEHDRVDALAAVLSGGAPIVNASQLRNFEFFDETPASECSGPVRLFPSEAAEEKTWLALTSDFLYESSTAKLRDRRAAVEHGIPCANESADAEIYELDCTLDSSSTCQTSPSVPFRRVSNTRIEISIDEMTMFVSVTASGALIRTEGALSIDDAVFFSVLRLCILILVAFVVYTRASRRSSGAGHCFISTLKIAYGNADEVPVFTSASSDALIGILAMLSHFFMVLFQGPLLLADWHSDVLVWTSIGLGVSLVQFLLRNFVLTGKEHPVNRLGGSMALANVSIATLLAFTKIPLLEAPRSDFNAIARLFAGVLIAVFAIPKSLFAVASTAMLARITSHRPDYDANYPRVLNVASLLWLLQSSALSFVLSRLFVVPAAYSLSRTSIGDSRQFEGALLLGTLCLSIPVINSAVVRILNEDEKAHSKLK
jgi:hypothetical protein